MKLYHKLATRDSETRFWAINRVFETWFPCSDVAGFTYVEIECLKLDLFQQNFKKIKASSLSFKPKYTKKKKKLKKSKTPSDLREKHKDPNFMIF